MLGQLRKAVGKSFLNRSYIRNLLSEGGNWTSNKVKNKGKKAPSLNRLSRARKMEKISLLTQFSVRAILSRVYVQLDARPIEKSYREIVYSWKSFKFESAEQCEGKSKTSPSTQFDNSRDS